VPFVLNPSGLTFYARTGKGAGDSDYPAEIPTRSPHGRCID
jgi:hypothetical protein